MEVLPNSIITFSDSLLSFSEAEQGFYGVGNRNFIYKYPAMIYAAKTKQELNWNFNNQFYLDEIKKPRPSVSLTDLYKERAQQLRDTYEYLILAYSGGVNSHNVLRSFIDNKIKLDEVWVDWPKQLIEKSGYTLSLSKEASNKASEWEYVIKLDLEQLRISNPEIKIHISDSCSLFLSGECKDTQTVISGLSDYVTNKRYEYIQDYSKKMNEKISTAVVTGNNKPIFFRIGQSYSFAFSDTSLFFKSSKDADGKCNVEYFYCSKNIPQVYLEQARCVWDYLLINRNLIIKRSVEHMKKMSENEIEKQDYNDIIKKICYPKWDLNKHQVNKTGLFTNTNFSNLLYNFKSEPFFLSWEKKLQENLERLDSKRFLVTKEDNSQELKTFFNFHSLGLIDRD